MPLGMISSLSPSGEENLVDYIRWLGGFDFERSLTGAAARPR